MFHMWNLPVGTDWWMVFGGTWMALFWGGSIALIVWGTKKLTGRDDSSWKSNPLQMARERYARGEISREEFEQLRKDLS